MGCQGGGTSLFDILDVQLNSYLECNELKQIHLCVYIYIYIYIHHCDMQFVISPPLFGKSLFTNPKILICLLVSDFNIADHFFKQTNINIYCWIQTLINLSKPTGHVTHHQFNIQQLYALPTLYLNVCIYLRTNSDLCHLQHKLIGFYNPDEKCLQRGTDWGFK